VSALDPVRLWSLQLTAPDGVVEQLHATLSTDERERAARFRFPYLRTRFVIARSALRALLGVALDVAPAAVVFRYGAAGKPAVAGGPEFNLSHSGDVALFALHPRTPLGVDVERLRVIADLEQIATRFFAPAETADLLALDPAERGSAFLRCWTRKEAFVKALGDGLSIPLSDFTVSLGPSEPAVLRELRGAPASGWALHSFEPEAECIAAVAAPDAAAVFAPVCRLHRRHLVDHAALADLVRAS